MGGASWRVRTLDWDEENREHISRHGVEEGEVEEIFRGRLYVRRVRKRRRTYYTVLGASETGRRLFVVVERLGPQRVRVVTARDMILAERRLFARRAR